MQSRATTEKYRSAADGERRAAAPPRLPPAPWRQRLRSRLLGSYEEDGVFRPVRLPLWIDLGVSAAIVVVAMATFAGFFVWLARTQ